MTGKKKAFLLKKIFLWGLIAVLGIHMVFGSCQTVSRAEPEEGPAMTEDVLTFPESYRDALWALKCAHPYWVFEPMFTGLDWNTVITRELQDGKSLVHKSFPNCTKEGAYDQGNWYYASRAVLEYYMDPRNSLTEDAIFQFEELGYHSACHTQEALARFLEGTFMNSGVTVPNTVMTYAQTIFLIGIHEEVQTSPFHLAARILQEQGQGTSPLISGTYAGYEGYYNYYNIGATGTTNQEVIENGLKYAKEHWGKNLGDRDDQGAYNALWGGAKYISSAYIRKGQDSLYLEKYNVSPYAFYAKYTHQYMQNISAPTTEAKSMRNLYASANALDSSFVFRIPVYDNMPEQACPMPTVSTNVVLNIPADLTSTSVLVDGTEYQGTNYYDYAKRARRLVVTLPDGNAKRAVLEVKNGQGEVTVRYYWDLTFSDTYYIATVGTAEEPIVLTNDVTLELPEGIGESQVWLDGIAYTGTISEGKLVVTAPDANAKTAVIYVKNESGVPVNMYVWTLQYGERGYEASYQPGLEGLLSYHGFSVRIRGKSGIRCKTGIGVASREQLLGEGINGYHLKEYGTIAMINSNRELYPMIKGGQKTVSGISYGLQEDGSLMDAIFETVSDRYRYTSVLVGLPAEQYKTEFAFRGYIVLEKDGAEIILYGPVVARSIYSLAQQLIGMAYYEEGSEPDLFLKQLISDADALEQQTAETENATPEGEYQAGFEEIAEGINAGEDGTAKEAQEALDETGKSDTDNAEGTEISEKSDADSGETLETAEKTGADSDETLETPEKTGEGTGELAETPEKTGEGTGEISDAAVINEEAGTDHGETVQAAEDTGLTETEGTIETGTEQDAEETDSNMGDEE